MNTGQTMFTTNMYCTNCHRTMIFLEKETYFECVHCKKKLLKAQGDKTQKNPKGTL